MSLGGCGSSDPAPPADEQAGAVGRYDIDPETGFVSAEHTDETGTTTRLEAGEALPVALPEPFVLYPGAQVRHNTRVEQADARLVYLDFETADSPQDVIAFYRESAEAAGITLNVEIEGDGIRTLGGGNAASQSEFSISARRTGETTQAQLVVGKGF